MATIKNIHKIADHIGEEDLTKLDFGASLHKRHSRIYFKVKSFEPGGELVVQVSQEKSPAENYLDKNGLIERAKDLFERFFPEARVLVHAIPYESAPVEIVTPKWIEQQMTEQSVRIKDIVSFTGMDKSIISGWITEARPMSQPVKAMFYCIFKGRFLV